MQCRAILLLDDDEDDYQLLKSMLHEAFHGTVTLDWFQRDGFADTMICSGDYLLTLVEYRLGLENGLEVIRKVKAKCPQQKIFLFTSWTQEAVSDQQALQAGAQRILRKTSLSADLVRELFQPLLEASPCPETSSGQEG